MRLPDQFKSESGVTALLVAMSLLVLMGMAALAVDIGLAMNERRQDQSAADVGSLAALQFAVPSPGCGSSCAIQAATNGANTAISVANASLEDPTLADWADSSLCGSPPSGFSASPVSDCVAFTNNFERAWVKIPTIASPTFFAKLFGSDQVDVSAFAIADQTFVNPGPVLPFLLPGNAAGTDYNCLKTGPNPSWGVCEELPTVGNFGSMDFYLYGNQPRNTTQKCSGDTNGRLVSNIARGVDHPLGIFPPPGTGSGTEEPSACPILGAEPNMAQGQSGVGSALEAGLITGGSAYSADGSAYDGLLEDSSGHSVRQAGGGKPEAVLNDVPLWVYLDPGSGEPACNGGVNTPAEMLVCIAAAKASGTVVFDDSIITSQRFGFTPEVWEMDFQTPGAFYHLKGYRPVYVDTTYYGCSNGPNQCDIVHTPGVDDATPCPPDPEMVTCGTAGPHTASLMAVTAYVLDPSILPDVAKSPAPGDDGQRRFNLSR